MIERTDYTPEDALLLAADEIDGEDDELIDKLTRLRRTFDENYRDEENS
jgi:hypothetical protein